MNPVFSNHFIFTVKNLEKIYRTIGLETYKNYYILSSFLKIIMWAICFKFCSENFAIIPFVCFVAVIVIYFFKPKVQVRYIYSKYREKYDREVEIHTFLYDNVIVSKNIASNKLVQALYSDIICVYKNVILCLYEKEFACNDQREFEGFIKEKCKTAKINL